MEKDKIGAGRDTTESTATLTGVEEDNPNYIITAIASTGHDLEQEQEQETGSHGTVSLQPARIPFTNLSQIDADLALARTLQEQERAYMMLRRNVELSDFGSWDDGSYETDDDDEDNHPNDGNGSDDNSNGGYDGTYEGEVVEEDVDVDDGSDGVDDDVDDDDDDDDDENEEEDAFDVQAHADDSTNYDYNSSIELDASAFSSDEAYARALQDNEDREMAALMLGFSGINDRGFDNAGDHGEMDDIEYHGDNSRDMWEEVDPDELSYEELVALGDVVGNENHGLAADKIARLPTMNYKAPNTQDGSNDSCVICRFDFEDGDTLTVLYCKHSYHADCLNQWLQLKKVCPICSAEATDSGNINQ